MDSAEIITSRRPGFLKRRFPKRYRRVRVLLIIFCILVVIRIILPYILCYVINNRMANIPGYYGQVDDVDLAIYRGAYVLNDIYLDKKDSLTGEQTPFLSGKRVDLSIEWGELFQGNLVGEVDVDSLSVKFTKDKMEPEQVKEDKNLLVDLGKSLMPLRLNRVEIKHSDVHYIDNTSSPTVDIFLDQLYILAQNLRTEKDTVLLPSTLIAKANIYGGNMVVGMKMDLLTDQPTFDMDAQVENVNLPSLNSFFKAYAKVDVNKGNFGLYVEAASRNGVLRGYMKPVIKNLDVLGHEDRSDNLFQKIWEGFVGAVGVVFTNPRNEQIATKIPLSGTLKKTEIDIWFGVYEILRNAFIEAIQSRIDHEISIASIDGAANPRASLRDAIKKSDKNAKANPKQEAKQDARKKAQSARQIKKAKRKALKQ